MQSVRIGWQQVVLADEQMYNFCEMADVAEERQCLNLARIINCISCQIDVSLTNGLASDTTEMDYKFFGIVLDDIDN